MKPNSDESAMIQYDPMRYEVQFCVYRIGDEVRTMVVSCSISHFKTLQFMNEMI